MKAGSIEVTAEKPTSKGLPLGLARSLLKVAEEQAAIRQSEIEAERSEKLGEAWEEGFKRGYGELQQVALDYQTARTELLEGLKPKLLELAFSLAEEALGEALKTQAESISARVSASLREIQQDSPLKIQLHPEDVRFLEHLFASGKNSAVTLITNERMPRGAVRIHSDSASWDLHPSEHLKRLEHHIVSNRLTDCVLPFPETSDASNSKP